MLVSSYSRIREFCETAGRKDAKALLAAWYKVAESANWEKFADVKADYGSVDQVGNCLVFDIGNNRYRLIARIIYDKHRVYILRVMAHKEYDRKLWIADCGCHKPPPKPKLTANPRKPRQKKKR